MSTPKISQFKVLLFDVYATLVDWETGIFKELQPLLERTRSGFAHDKKAALLALNSIENDIQAQYPTMLYADVLAKAHAEFAARLSNAPGPAQSATAVSGTAETTAVSESEEDVEFGQSIARWPIFPDTIPALAYLSKHYKLAVLSNVDHTSFARTRAALETSDAQHPFAFDAVYTAQDIGSYKPDLANFRYALAQLEATFGVTKEEVLVVAASLSHDHVPANHLGIRSAFIERQGSVIGLDVEADYDFKFKTMGDMAEAVRQEAGLEIS